MGVVLGGGEGGFVVGADVARPATERRRHRASITMAL